MTPSTPARLLLVGALTALTVLAGGCSSGGGSGATPAGVSRSTAPGPSSAPTTAGGTTRPATPGPTTVPTTVVTGLSMVTLPSGNIGCALQGGTARCDIRSRTWRPPPRPASCPLDYGQGLEVGTSAELVCAGDTVLGGDGPTLAYGTALRTGDVVCTSSPQGGRCSNERSGHGFTLSREAYGLF